MNAFNLIITVKCWFCISISILLTFHIYLPNIEIKGYGIEWVAQIFKCSQNFSGSSFARARIFLQVLACSVFGKGSFCRVLAARKANFYRCSCSQRKTMCSHGPHARKCSQRTIRYPKCELVDLKFPRQL